MAQTNYYIGRTTNSAGESEINLRLYISRDVRLRIGSGIWIDRKRWGKKNDINIPLIQGEEREQLLGKRSRLKALTDLLEQEINTTPDKAAITREYMQGIVKRFHKPTKAKKEHEKTFFNVIDIYLATHKLSENRLKNFSGAGTLPTSFRAIHASRGKPRIFAFVHDAYTGIAAPNREFLTR